MADVLHVFTCAAVNYLPKVRILCHSIRRHHPEAVIHLALADERPQWLRTEDEPFDSIIGIERLGIPDYDNWTFTHSIVELSTAIKPFALKHLLQLPDCATVLYFDPDMVLFSRVDDILATLATSNLALTPHQTKPEQTLDAIFDNEVASLKHGIFNLGFIGVRNTAEGRRFADWWAERTYHLCWADVENGLFTDQKWINFAPVFFDGVAIIKSSRHNVATWNLTTRRMTGTLATGFEVDGEPLGFYHFTGFDSGAHRIMAIKNASASPAVQELITWYEGETAVADRDPVAEWPWAFGRFADGTPIEPGHRRVYRDHDDLQKGLPRALRRRNGPAELSRLVQDRRQGALPRALRGRRHAPGAEGRPHGHAGVASHGAPTVRPHAVAEGRQGVARALQDGVPARRLRRLRAAIARAAWAGALVIDVIIPVYKGLQQTRRCIDGVLKSRQATPFEIVAVDDASPDPDITRYLDELAAQGRITLVRNESNLGFVQSVNRGMALHPDRDVVLLNSDTEVANDWLDRLRHAADAHPHVGTVTPFSNNATICSYPFEGWSAGVPGTLGLATFDRLFASTNAGRTVDLPTAVGFCMFIRRACLDQVGLFDALTVRARLRRGERFLHAGGPRGLAQRARGRRVRLP